MSCKTVQLNLIAKLGILKSGGFVANSRVFGVLIPSRTFGDFSYKLPSTPPSSSPTLLSEPELHHITLTSPTSATPEHRDFMVIGSDGLFGVLDNDEIVQIVGDLLRKGKGPTKAATKIVELAHDKGSTDGIMSFSSFSLFLT